MTTPPVSASLALPAALDDPWLRRLLTGIVSAMTSVVVVVAALAFVASFGAIHDYALRSGGIARQHAWMAPLFVDSFLFIGSCGDLWYALTRSDAEDGWHRIAAWSPKLLLIAAAAGSYGLNIAHAPATVPARVVAALPPTALVVTEIVLMFIVRRAVHFRTARLAIDTEALAPTPIGQRDLRTKAHQLIAAHQTRGHQINGTELARQLGTSARHGRRLLAEYRAEAAAVSPNGENSEERPTQTSIRDRLSVVGSAYAERRKRRPKSG
jgi:hypothetical protein